MDEQESNMMITKFILHLQNRGIFLKRFRGMYDYETISNDEFVKLRNEFVEGQQLSTQDSELLESSTGCSMAGLDKLTVRGDS